MEQASTSDRRHVMTNVLDLLRERVSTRPDQLVEPAPDDADIEKMVTAAVTAPDHGGLRPWRFIVIRGEARRRLGDVFANAAQQRRPSIDPAELEKLRGKPQRAPLIIAVAAAIRPDHPGVPVIEQIQSASAAAQQLQLAANALGFGCIWLTGDSAHDPSVAEALGLDFDDRLIGFVHIGTVDGVAPGPVRPDAAGFLREWTEPLALETL
jgi:nitroreductase